MVYVIPEDNFFSNPKPKHVKKSENSIFNSLKFFIIFCQLLGILPQENITVSQEDMYFTWKSWKTAYTLFLVGMSTFASSVCLLDWFMNGYVFMSVGTTVFYSGPLVILVLYLRLARSWAKLILLWCKMDKIMNNSYGYPRSLDRRFHLMFAIYVLLTLANYGFTTIQMYINLKSSFGSKYKAEKFYFEAFPQMFRFVPFNVFSAILCSILLVHSTLVWLANDLFIILISIALALRFKQISERLARNQKLIKNLHFWIEIREDYDRLSLLCKDLDRHMSYLILLSFSLNIFFLLVRLYHCLAGFSNFLEQLSFIYTFMYLIIKVVSVSLYAAWINDESVAPASILNSVPASSYNIEIRRLLTQISFDNVALTGCRMFKVTRGIVLSIAGAIVTYELVLIQFNAATGG